MRRNPSFTLMILPEVSPGFHEQFLDSHNQHDR